MQLLELEAQASITHHSTGPARKDAQAGEFKRYTLQTRENGVRHD
jgi:hypothetical protein